MRKIYKRVAISFLLSFSFILLVGCGNKVTIDDLKKNDWLIVSTIEDEPNMIASFSDSIVRMKIDVSGMESSAKNEWEEMGEEFAKSLVDLMEFNFEYTLKGKQITLLDIESDEESSFIVSREDKNIIFTPEGENKNESEVLTLEPYTKKEETKEATEQSTTSESTLESTEISVSSSELKISSTTTYSEEPTTYTPEVTLNDFIGGWGVPHTNMLFFINSDGTFSDLENANVPLANPVFGTTDDGRSLMTIYRTDGSVGDFILEFDGTLTTAGRSYHPMEYTTLEDFRARPDAKPNEYSTPKSVELLNSQAAIEKVKLFMAGDNDISMTDSYSFIDDNGLMYDENNQPYYSIRIRQDAKGDFNSMAIGNVTIYADTGECFWQ